jgi:lipopolysaccharide export system protein LptA
MISRFPHAKLKFVQLPILALTLTLALASRPALALKDDEKQPMLIEADKVELDEAKSTSTYTGNVQVDQGSMRLLADLVTVTHRPDRRVKTVVAEGAPAKFKQLLDDNQGEVHAFARRMDFDADRNELTLIDDALLIQGQDRISSNRIVYDRARSRMQAGGTGRVKMTLVPEKKEEKPSANGQAPKRPAAQAPAAPPARGPTLPPEVERSSP